MKFCVAVFVLCLVAGGLWLATRAVAPPEVAQAPIVAPITAQARPGTVGKTMRATAGVRFAKTPAQVTGLGGLVTAIGEEAPVRSPHMMVAIDGKPLFGVHSEMPFYRDLAVEDQGLDVQATHRALRQSGYYKGRINAAFSDASQRAWDRFCARNQRAHPALTPEQCSVSKVFLALHPATSTLAYGSNLRVGGIVAEGTSVASSLAGEPHVAIEIREGEAGRYIAGQKATASINGQEIQAVVNKLQPVDQQDGESSNSGAPSKPPGGGNQPQEAVMTAPDGSPLCADGCADSTLRHGASIPFTIEIVPPTSGLAVPVAAIRQSSDNTNYVELEDGSQVTVTVRASDKGIAIVDGLSDGQRVRLSEASDAKPAS